MLALVQDEERDVTSSERRFFTRRPTTTRAEARRLDHSVAARRQPRLDLELRDVSLMGVSAIAEQPLEWGEHVVVKIPPTRGMSAWNAFGRVVRCEPSAMGYRVAVEFESLPAA